MIVSTRVNYVDFVSRLFGPSVEVNEDPVTGSAHTTLTPYWCKILGKKTMSAIQLSPRGGKLTCTDKGSRVEISGQAILYLKGELLIQKDRTRFGIRTR